MFRAPDDSGRGETRPRPAQPDSDISPPAARECPRRRRRSKGLSKGIGILLFMSAPFGLSAGILPICVMSSK
jgi:hypothetical protein